MNPFRLASQATARKMNPFPFASQATARKMNPFRLASQATARKMNRFPFAFQARIQIISGKKRVQPICLAGCGNMLLFDEGFARTD